MGGIFGGGSKGPDVAELQKQQDLAIQKERERLAAEQAQKERADQGLAVASLEETESRRRAFAGTLGVEGDTEERRKFLKSA